MVPESSKMSVNNAVFKKEDTKTYFIDYENMCIKGFCDGEEAVKQAIRKILETERYMYLIYSFNYGFERSFEKYSGRSVFPILRKNIEEALLQDDRIKEVKDFLFSRNGSAVNVQFTVVTDRDEIVYEKVVDVVV